MKKIEAHTFNIEPKIIVYKCDQCKDSGRIKTTEDESQYYETGIGDEPDIHYKNCECRNKAEFERKMDKKNSGIEHSYDKFTFKNYETKFEWQKEYKNKAMEFARKPSGAFVMLGGTSSGKTHLCTAIITNLAYKGYHVHYVEWRALMSDMKFGQIDPKRLEYIFNIPVLYIDDLMKSMDGNDHTTISSKEKSYAWQIIDARLKRNKITIISSEYTMKELGQVDMSLISRIMEMATKKNFIDMPRNEDRNIRIMQFEGDF